MFGQVLAIIAFFLYIFWYKPAWWLKLWSQCEVTKLPGPYGIPILGTRWVYSKFGKYSMTQVHEFYQDMFEKFGPIFKEEALWNVPVISIVKKGDIEKVLRSSGKYPLRPPTEAIAYYRKTRPDRYASTGMVNEQGLSWYKLRTNLAQEVTSIKTINSFIPVIEDIAEDWCNLLLETRDSQNFVSSLENYSNKLGLEAICSLVLGRRMGFLYKNQPHSSITTKLAEAVKDHFLACRDTYFGLPLWKLYETSAYKKLITSEEIIYDLVLELIKTADDSTRESSVFQSVIKADVDDKEKTAAIVDFIAAGIYTMRNSLIFALSLIGKHENAQNLIVEDDSGCYTKACINESFRLLPTANSLARITEDELEICGFKLPSGSVMLCHTGLACRDATNFTRPNEFLPERWLSEEKSKTKTAATYLVIPFGIGKRTCPGKRFIEQVLQIIVKRTVEKFKISMLQDLCLQFEFLLAPKGPINMIFEERR